MIPALIDPATLADLDAEYEHRAQHIPYGNSDFQNRAFAIGGYEGAERQYRATLLRWRDRRQALREAQYNLRRNDIEMRRLQAKIDDPATDAFDRELAQIDLEERRERMPDAEKLIRDAIAEMETCVQVARGFPELTRAEFEAGELPHFTAHLAIASDPHSVAALRRYEEAYLALPGKNASDGPIPLMPKASIQP